jgi:3-hydroxypropanoate dehydrogenase
MRNINDIFKDRTCNKFLDKAVSKELLMQIHDMAKLGPTSGNCCPLRIVFVQSPAEKDKLSSCLMEGNIEKTKAAPVTALFAYDAQFYNGMEVINPVAPELIKFFASSKDIALDTATRNSTLQAAYFMLAARGLGLDCGPMSGFNKESIEKNFFADTKFKINFICNLGYADGESEHPRLPRWEFDQVCKIV